MSQTPKPTLPAHTSLRASQITLYESVTKILRKLGHIEPDSAGLNASELSKLIDIDQTTVSRNLKNTHRAARFGIVATSASASSEYNKRYYYDEDTYRKQEAKTINDKKKRKILRDELIKENLGYASAETEVLINKAVEEIKLHLDTVLTTSLTTSATEKPADTVTPIQPVGTDNASKKYAGHKAEAMIDLMVDDMMAIFDSYKGGKDMFDANADMIPKKYNNTSTDTNELYDLRHQAGPTNKKMNTIVILLHTIANDVRDAKEYNESLKK